MEIAVFIAGAALVLWVLLTAVRTVVLPRAVRAPLSWGVFGLVVAIFKFAAARRRSYEAQEGTLALIGPVGLLAVPAAWMFLVLVGFTAMFWATDPGLEVRGAFNLAGSSITTLGFTAGHPLEYPVVTLSQPSVDDYAMPGPHCDVVGGIKGATQVAADQQVERFLPESLCERLGLSSSYRV